MTNDDIATALFVPPLTAKTHVNGAMAKLGAGDRAQLVVIAYQTGLVRAGDPDRPPVADRTIARGPGSTSVRSVTRAGETASRGTATVVGAGAGSGTMTPPVRRSAPGPPRPGAGGGAGPVGAGP